MSSGARARRCSRARRAAAGVVAPSCPAAAHSAAKASVSPVQWTARRRAGIVPGASSAARPSAAASESSPPAGTAPRARAMEPPVAAALASHCAGAPLVIPQGDFHQQIRRLVANPAPQVAPFRGRFVKVEPARRRVAAGEVNPLPAGRFPVAAGQRVRVGGHDGGKDHAGCPRRGRLDKTIQRRQVSGACPPDCPAARPPAATPAGAGRSRGQSRTPPAAPAYPATPGMGRKAGVNPMAAVCHQAGLRLRTRLIRAAFISVGCIVLIGRILPAYIPICICRVIKAT